MEKTFDDWCERSEKINSLLEAMTSAPTISTWLYLEGIVNGYGEKDSTKTDIAKAIIGNLVELADEVKEQIEQIKVYWDDPEYVKLFKETDEKFGDMKVTTSLPNIWGTWLSIELGNLKELQELYQKAFEEE